MQVTGRNTTLMRWLRHRGGAQHHARWQKEKRAPLPVAAVIGADPATIIAAVTPVPETLSEYQFAGLLRGKAVELVPCKTVPLQVPAEAEIVLEGHVSLDDYGDEGPYGDHTGYYNAVEKFPVFTVSAITMRRDPIYLSTFTGRPPDEPSMLGHALNEIFVPLLAPAIPGDRRFLAAARGLLLPHRRGLDEEGVSRPRQARDDGGLVAICASSCTRNGSSSWTTTSTRAIGRTSCGRSRPAWTRRATSRSSRTPRSTISISPRRSRASAPRSASTPPTNGRARSNRAWGRKLAMTDEIVETVTRRWSEYGLPGSGKKIWK